MEGPRTGHAAWLHVHIRGHLGHCDLCGAGHPGFVVHIPGEKVDDTPLVELRVFANSYRMLQLLCGYPGLLHFLERGRCMPPGGALKVWVTWF